MLNIDDDRPGGGVLDEPVTPDASKGSEQVIGESSGLSPETEVQVVRGVVGVLRAAGVTTEQMKSRRDVIDGIAASIVATLSVVVCAQGSKK